MPPINCPECGKVLWNATNSCPQCGWGTYPRPNGCEKVIKIAEATTATPTNEERPETDEMVPASTPYMLRFATPSISVFGFIVATVLYLGGVAALIKGMNEVNKYGGDEFTGYFLVGSAFSCWISGVIVHLLSSIATKVSWQYELTKMEIASRRIREPKS